jgi:FkbM family methyltransferase
VTVIRSALFNRDERQATETCFKLDCGHAFHTKCIVQFLKRSTLECPGCNKKKTPTEQVEYEAVVRNCMNEVKKDPRFIIAKTEYSETKKDYKLALVNLKKEMNEYIKKRATELNIYKYRSYYLETVANVRSTAKEISKEKGKCEKFENTKYFNHVISDTDDQTVTFNISNNDGQSSSIFDLEYHKIAHPGVFYVKKIELKTKRIDTIFKENKLDMKDYNFVNMDIQGAEYLALLGFGDLLNEVDYISLEINERELYKGCTLFPQITEYLESYGFQFKEKIMWEDCGWGDAFFIRDKNKQIK